VRPPGDATLEVSFGTDPKLQNLKVGAVYNFTDFFDDLTDRDLTISSELGR